MLEKHLETSVGAECIKFHPSDMTARQASQAHSKGAIQGASYHL